MIRTFFHAGVGVTDLDASLHFYRDLLGMEVIRDRVVEGEFLSRLTRLPNRRVRVVLVKKGDGIVELGKTLSEVGPRHVPLSNHIGPTHIAFVCRDLDGLYDRLSAEGVEFISEPVSLSPGSKVVMCRDPDGTLVELTQRADQPGQPDDTGVSGLFHAGLGVADLDRSLHFYRDLLGFPVVMDRVAEGEKIERVSGIKGRKAHAAWLRAGKGLIELSQSLAGFGEKHVTSSNHVGFNHIAFICDDLDSLYERLSAADVPFISPPLSLLPGRASVFCRDPDDVLVELTQIPGAEAPL